MDYIKSLRELYNELNTPMKVLATLFLVIIGGILCFYLIILAYGAATGHHVNLRNGEIFSEEKNKFDTSRLDDKNASKQNKNSGTTHPDNVLKHDTVFIKTKPNAPRHLQSKKTSDSIRPITQNNNQGDNNLNTGTNYGHIGKEEITVVNEIHLLPIDKENFLKEIKIFQTDSNTRTKCIMLTKTAESNASTFFSEAYEFLKKEGYDVRKSIVYYPSILKNIGVTYRRGDDCIEFTIGVFQ